MKLEEFHYFFMRFSRPTHHILGAHGRSLEGGSPSACVASEGY